MKENPESLISAPLLDQVVVSHVTEMHHIQGILLTVVHNLPCGVNPRRIHVSKWFCDTSTGAAQEQPTVVLLWGMPLASWLLALGEREGHEDLRGSDRLSVIPYVHGRTELYCAQACLT
jgi:hypothetical protein